jgi:hypothetical protein
VDSDKKLKEFLFEYFWECYQKKNRKPNALREFKKLNFKEIAKVFSNVKIYVSNNTKYRLMPHNYLKDKVFNDEITIQEESKDSNTLNIDAKFDRTLVNKDNDVDDYFAGFE